MAVKTPLKWAGNKSSIMAELKKHLPAGERLVEPFAGSCSLMLNTDYDRYLVADVNPDLVRVYKAMAHHTDALLAELEILFSAGSVGDDNSRGEFYYSIRHDFNTDTELSRVERAARFIYLNRHCFNGLARYNQRGHFNVPCGRYKNPYFPETEIRHFAEKAKRATFICADFSETLQQVRPGDVIYCDPPYNPVDGKNSFTNYYQDGFSDRDAAQLAARLHDLGAAGYPVVASNSDSLLTHAQYGYGRFDLHEINVRRSVGASAFSRVMAREIIATKHLHGPVLPGSLVFGA